MTIKEILEEAKKLTPLEREKLSVLLMSMIDAERPPAQRRLSELRGLGKDIWQGVDAQEYVDQLRDEWDERP